MHVCGGRGSVYEFSYLNGLNTCHMICSNCTASIWGTVVFCSLCINLFENSLNSFSLFPMELTLFKVSVFWHEAGDRAPFQMFGSAGPSKIALAQVAEQQGAKRQRMGEPGSSECDTFILTNWNVFFCLPPHLKMTLTSRLTKRICLFLRRRGWSSQGVLASSAHSPDDL